MINEQILPIKQYLKDVIIPTCSGSNYNTNCYRVLVRLIQTVIIYKAKNDAVSKMTIDEVKKHIPIILECNHIADLKCLLVKKFTDFITENRRFPEEGELIVDGFLDLYNIRFMNIRSMKFKLLGRNRIYGNFKKEMIIELYNKYLTAMYYL